jgi:hypothetical protein
MENLAEVTELENLAESEVTESIKLEEKEAKKRKPKKYEGPLKVKVKLDSDGLKFGVYENRRLYNGQEFEIKHPRLFSDKWMECLEPEKLEAYRNGK